jgi:hypothetical protein
MGIYGIYTSRQQMAPALRAMLDLLLSWFESKQPRGLSNN